MFANCLVQVREANKIETCDSTLDISLKFPGTPFQIVLYDKQDGIHCQGPMPPPRCFLYLTETTSWKWEEGEEEGEGEREGGEKVSLKTHATTRGMGKNERMAMSNRILRRFGQFIKKVKVPCFNFWLP